MRRVGSKQGVGLPDLIGMVGLKGAEAFAGLAQLFGCKSLLVEDARQGCLVSASPVAPGGALPLIE